ncbi:MAG: S41 family peptidase, partial [Geminicoccaceae bacterium]
MKAEVRAALTRRIKEHPAPRMEAQRRGRPAAAAPAELTLDERQAIIETVITLIDGLYPHIAQKRAAFGLDPQQRLRVLGQRVDDLDDDGFHQAMIRIVTDLRDSHTRYVGPSRQMGEIAFLPVMIEAYSEGDEDHYIISKVFALTSEEKARYTKAGLVPEVRVTHWNGVKIGRAVAIHGQSRPAARRDAQRARALDSLTLRSLRYELSADEDWVDVTFVKADGRQGSVRLNWRTINLEDAPMVAKGLGRTLYAFAGDPATEASRRTKKALFAPEIWHADEHAPASKPEVITAKAVQSDSGERFGYLRLWSFDVIDDDLYLQRLREAIGGLPQNGLIIDLRGNPGGLIWAAERLLQLFTPDAISPVRFSFIATNLTREPANAPQ